MILQKVLVLKAGAEIGNTAGPKIQKSIERC